MLMGWARSSRFAMEKPSTIITADLGTQETRQDCHYEEEDEGQPGHKGSLT